MKFHGLHISSWGYSLRLLIVVTILIPSVYSCKGHWYSFNRYHKDALTSLKEFETNNYPQWISTYGLDILQYRFINSQQKITSGPARTWWPLIRLDTLKQVSLPPKGQMQKIEKGALFDNKSFCLIYRFPSNKIYSPNVVIKDSKMLGELKVVELSKSASRKCEDSLLLPSDNLLPDIYSLNIWVTDHNAYPIPFPELDADTHNSQLQPFHLYLMGELHDKVTNKRENFLLSFPLYNLKVGAVVLDPKNKRQLSSALNKKYASSISVRLIDGLTISSLKDSRQENTLDIGSDSGFGIIAGTGQGSLMLGQIDDRYSSQEAIKCHSVNANCETVTEREEGERFKCDRCRFGYYEVVGNGCSLGGDKYCGSSHCGDKGEPACSRGREWNGNEMLVEGETYASTSTIGTVCEREIAYSFCQQGLTPNCDSKGTVVCIQ